MKKSKMAGSFAWILCAVIFLAGCGSESNVAENEDSSVAVEVMDAATGSLVLTNQFVGTVAPQESGDSIPMAQGTVTHTYFEVGDTVEAGDVLLEIDDTAAQLQLKQAQLTYNNTKAQVNSSWTSTNDQLSNTLKQLEAQRLGALAQLEGAQTQYFTLVDSVNQGNEAL